MGAMGIEYVIDLAEGRGRKAKIRSLVTENLGLRLKECEREIAELEVQYRSDFADFSRRWRAHAIREGRSFEVERDYMVWEGLMAERKRLLSLLKKI